MLKFSLTHACSFLNRFLCQKHHLELRLFFWSIMKALPAKSTNVRCPCLCMYMVWSSGLRLSLDTSHSNRVWLLLEWSLQFDTPICRWFIPNQHSTYSLIIIIGKIIIQWFIKLKLFKYFGQSQCGLWRFLVSSIKKTSVCMLGDINYLIYETIM